MIQITEEVADSISDTKSPQGIFITVRHLDKILNLSTIDSSRQFIILENLQDMGNIGTIIRSCDAFSIDGVILVGDCADVFAPKTVRSDHAFAKGRIYRVFGRTFRQVGEARRGKAPRKDSCCDRQRGQRRYRYGEEPLRQVAVHSDKQCREP